MIIKEIVFLVVMVMTGTNNSPLFYYHEIPTMQQCFAIVENGQIHIPDAGDAEATVTMYCAPTKVGYWHYAVKPVPVTLPVRIASPPATKAPTIRNTTNPNEETP